MYVRLEYGNKLPCLACIDSPFTIIHSLGPIIWLINFYSSNLQTKPNSSTDIPGICWCLPSLNPPEGGLWWQSFQCPCPHYLDSSGERNPQNTIHQPRSSTNNQLATVPKYFFFDKRPTRNVRKVVKHEFFSNQSMSKRQSSSSVSVWFL